MSFAVKPEENHKLECYKIVSQIGSFKYLRGGVFILSRTQLNALKKAGIPFRELPIKPITSEIQEKIKQEKGTEHIFLP